MTKGDLPQDTTNLTACETANTYNWNYSCVNCSSCPPGTPIPFSSCGDKMVHLSQVILGPSGTDQQCCNVCTLTPGCSCAAFNPNYDGKGTALCTVFTTDASHPDDPTPDYRQTLIRPGTQPSSLVPSNCASDARPGWTCNGSPAKTVDLGEDDKVSRQESINQCCKENKDAGFGSNAVWIRNHGDTGKTSCLIYDNADNKCLGADGSSGDGHGYNSSSYDNVWVF